MAKSRVSFLYGNFLQYDGRTIEASTVSPAGLYDIICDAADMIREKLFSMPGNDRESRQDRPVILVARLAPIKERTTALTPLGRANGSAIHIDSAEIIDDFLPYWIATTRTGFAAQVRSAFEGGGPRVDGVWLGVYNNG